MKKTVLTLAISFLALGLFAREIEAIVIFENLSGKELIEGEFFVVETNQRIKVSKDESFRISLPKKGKYQFRFTAEDFTAYTFYPERINKRNNTITVRLMNKGDMSNGSENVFGPVTTETQLSDEQLEERIESGTLNFIMHGIDNSVPEGYKKFKEKYGIGLVKENCVLDPLSYKKAVTNNSVIAHYLNRKFGTAWLQELPNKPFGIK